MKDGLKNLKGRREREMLNNIIVDGTMQHKQRGSFLIKTVKVFLIVVIIATQSLTLSAFEAHVINVTARVCQLAEVRSMGYWMNHLEYFSDCFPVIVGGEKVDQERAEGIFDAIKGQHDMEDMLRAQTLAMTLNIQCSGIDPSEGEEKDGMTLEEIIVEANRLLEEGGTREEMEYYKDLIVELIEMEYIKYCFTSPDWFTGFESLRNPNKDNSDDNSEAFDVNQEKDEGDSEDNEETSRDVLGERIEVPSDNSSTTPPINILSPNQPNKGKGGRDNPLEDASEGEGSEEEQETEETNESAEESEKDKEIKETGEETEKNGEEQTSGDEENSPEKEEKVEELSYIETTNGTTTNEN